MTRRLTRLDILRYALNGAKTERSLCCERMTDEEMKQLDKDIGELNRRLWVAEAREPHRKEDSEL